MSSTTQPTMDGAPAPPPPPPPHKGGRPRLPLHLQTPQLERQRVRAAERATMHPGHQATERRRQRKTRRITSPPLPFSPLTASHKMAMLLEWHHTCAHSQYDWERDHDHRLLEREANPPDPKEDHRILTSAPEHRETYEKRKPHYDE